MMDKRHQVWWRRAAAVVGLLSLLCFWTAAVAHVHGVTPQSGVRHDCQLCVAGRASQTLFTDAPIAVAFLFVLYLLVPVVGRPHVVRYHRSSPPRSPPVSL